MREARPPATARIELRTTGEVKELLKTAAAREQLDLTSFILRHAVVAAEEALARRDRRVLSERDTELILDLLENPPAPSEEMIEAARRLQRNRVP